MSVVEPNEGPDVPDVESHADEDAGVAQDVLAPTNFPYAEALAELAHSAGPKPSASTALDAFLLAVQATGLSLYPAQEEAMLELASGRHVVLATPTGSGKSLVAEFALFLARAQGRRAFYTCPVKALVSEKFFALCRGFGPEQVGMLTGDASINRDADIICCTAEILANVSVGRDAHLVDDVVMDEFHYYGDASRGTAWQLPLLSLPRARFLLMSATLGDTRTIGAALTRDTGREVAEVTGHERPVPLDFSWREVPLTETLAELLAAKKTPAYVVHFSQREAVEAAQAATSSEYLDRAEKATLLAELAGFRFDTPFGRTMRRLLGHGVGVHHAGLLPKYRLLVEKLAQRGLLRVIMGTDTLGVGINVPIRTVVFTKLTKFDGEKVGVLSARDFAQIAGRAGRRGYDAEGSVVAQAPEHVVENRRMLSRAGDDAKKARKLVKKKPPRGYVPWDANTFAKLQVAAPEALVPRFVLDQHLLLTVLRQHPDGYRALTDLVARSHVRPREKTQLRRRARALFRTLRAGEIVHVNPSPGRRRPPQVLVNETLGEDFSLTHALALFLLDALPLLDEDAPSYPLDVLSLVESILDNPDSVLARVADRARKEAIDSMRAAGLDYEQRMAELEKVSYPKPLEELIYPAFNAWEARHPWAAGATIRPKGVARELVEHCSSFSAYVRDYGLERAEGVLLRYLSQVLQALVHSLPRKLLEGPLLDVVSYLRLTLGQVDASLLEAWTALADPESTIEPAADADARATAPQVPSAAEMWQRRPQVLAARVRAELHALLGALARRAFGEARACLGGATGSAEEIEAEAETGEENSAAAAPMSAAEEAVAEAALQATLAPLFAEHAAIDIGPPARRAQWTQLTQVAPGRLQATQTVLADGEPTVYTLVTHVVLGEAPLGDAPLLRGLTLSS